MERLTDVDMIASTLAHPKVYPSISDDYSLPPQELNQAISESIIYLGAYSDQYLGLFMIHQHNGILYEGHTCLLPVAWGRATECAKACIAWIFENTACRRLITTVPDGNALALRLALRSGMTQYGHNPESIQKGGRLIGQSLLGITKGATCQPQQ